MDKNNETYLTSIIILNYNGGKHLLECVESVFKTKNVPLEIILIDNNSTDKSQIECKEKFPDIKLIQNDANVGLSARNLGVQKSKGEYVVFLDSDTIVNENWLDILLQSFEQNGSGLYQPKLIDKEEKNLINSGGNMINIFGLGFSRGKGKEDKGQYEKFQRISYTSGACTFSSAKIIKKIGKIDEIFFAYHDDLDFGWRGQLLGIPSFYEPKSIVFHYGSPTLKWSEKKFYYLERNRWICILSLYSFKTLSKLFPFLIILEIGIFFYLISKGMGKSKIKSFISIIKLQKEIRIRKCRFNDNRMVTDKDVIKNFVNEFELPDFLENNMHKKLKSIIVSISKFVRPLI